MTTFSSILYCPLSNTAPAAVARKIGELAVKDHAALTMFGVLPEPARFKRAHSRFDELRDVIVEHNCDAMTERLRRWSPKDVADPQIVVESGSAAIKIIERVISEGHDLVVVTADADDHSTVKRLLRKCPCPVWVVRPTRPRKQRVLVAVNADPDEEELNQHLLEIGARMVELFGGELHVVHAWELWGEGTMRSSAFMHTPEAELEALLKAEYDAHNEAVEALVADAGLANHSWEIHVVKGPAARVINATVARHKINLLVMGTVARKGLAGVLMGNTAERVIDDLACSLITAKPSGFVSPLAG